VEAGGTATEPASVEAGGAGVEAAGAGTADAQEPPVPGRWSRRLPSWARRRPVITTTGAGVLVAVVIALVVFATTRPPAPQAEYTSLPRQSCTLVSPAELARYLPGATGTPLSADSNVRTVKAGGCRWLSTSGGEDRTLTAAAFIFRSADPVTGARQSYHATVARLLCRCKGVTVSSQNITGLGDQATEVFIAVAPDANPARSPNASAPGTHLLVLLGNALVIIDMNTTGTASGAFLTSPPSAAQLAGMISMARTSLAILASPGSLPATAIGPLSPEPHYGGRPDPCKLVSAATLARFAPGTTLTPTSTPGSSPSSCSWATAGTPGVLLNLTLFPTVQDALHHYDMDAGAFVQGVNDVTVTGVQELPDVGEGAEAIFQSQSGDNAVNLLVWSGNAELSVTYTDIRSGVPAKADRATLLAGAIAMSRDGLAALAQPAASAYQQGPLYATPSHPCQLLRASTLARYAPGAVVGPLPAGGPADLKNCAWNASNADLFLTVTTYLDPDTAEGGFEFDLQLAHHAPDTTFSGEQQVTSLGQQATAVFGTGLENTPQVDLYAWSGNAVVEMIFSDSPFGSASLNRAGKLAADIAMIRDVLAGLHRT
jgi:hypothetical protein